MSPAPPKLALPGPAKKFIALHHYAAAGKNNFGHARHLDPLEHGVIDPHVVSLGANRLFPVGIEDNDVSIAAHCDSSFARIKAKQFCRSGGNQFDKSVHVETSVNNSARVNQAHAMLNARAS